MGFGDPILNDGGSVNYKFKGLIMWFLLKLKWWIFERTKKIKLKMMKIDEDEEK